MSSRYRKDLTVAMSINLIMSNKIVFKILSTRGIKCIIITLERLVSILQIYKAVGVNRLFMSLLNVSIIPKI